MGPGDEVVLSAKYTVVPAGTSATDARRLLPLVIWLTDSSIGAGGGAWVDASSPSTPQAARASRSGKVRMVPPTRWGERESCTRRASAAQQGPEYSMTMPKAPASQELP